MLNLTAPVIRSKVVGRSFVVPDGSTRDPVVSTKTLDPDVGFKTTP